MDPLSDVLRAVKLNGAYFYQVEAAAPWAVLTKSARELTPRVLPQAEHLISYHILLSGSCWGGVEGEQQVRLQAGDAIIFPHGDAHLMSSSEGLMQVQHQARSRPPFPEKVLIGPDTTRDTTFVCGFLGLDARPFNPLMLSLPRRLHMRGDSDGWLARFPRQVVEESRLGRVGRLTMLTRMAELMFIEVVRQYLDSIPESETGWLAGLVDEVVAPALTHLHREPARPWTLAELSRLSATSRSVLAERFSRLVGLPPMLYLKRWRLQLAAEQLANGSAKVAAVGKQVGYDSEAAFSRAFKQETGLSPAAWRQARGR
jgi:AraC-like DNA-binding protein